jgi:Protein of unknown function (DUF1559)
MTRLVIAAALLALPACDKKKDDDSGGGGASPSGEPKGGLGLSRANASAFRNGQSNLMHIGRALHNYHDAMGTFPASIYGPDGKSLGLSWRVAILPYIEESALHNQFKMNEPWDSENNKKLLTKMPKVFAAPGGFLPAGYTYLRSFTGPGTVMNPRPGAAGAAGAFARGLSLASITDGTSNTGVVAEGGDPVIWTKPDEIVFVPKGPLPKLGGVFSDGVNVLMGDGMVRFFPASTSPDLLRAIITADGGETWTDSDP